VILPSSHDFIIGATRFAIYRNEFERGKLMKFSTFSCLLAASFAIPIRSNGNLQALNRNFDRFRDDINGIAQQLASIQGGNVADNLRLNDIQTRLQLLDRDARDISDDMRSIEVTTPGRQVPQAPNGPQVPNTPPQGPSIPPQGPTTIETPIPQAPPPQTPPSDQRGGTGAGTGPSPTTAGQRNTGSSSPTNAPGGPETRGAEIPSPNPAPAEQTNTPTGQGNTTESPSTPETQNAPANQEEQTGSLVNESS
jgi:hypothetical protein